MDVKASLGWRIGIVGILGAGACLVLLLALWGRAPLGGAPAAPRGENIGSAAPSTDAAKTGSRLQITYPPDEALFPPEIVEPTFRWLDEHRDADAWVVAVEFADGKDPVKALTNTTEWMPSPEQWATIKARSVEWPAKVKIAGVNQAAPDKPLSSAMIRISTSKDEVGAPLFFREVNLPFLTAVYDPARHIRWRFGPISSREPPPIVLEKLAVCGNCHSFSRDGTTLAMEVDSGNQKGGYTIAPRDAGDRSRPAEDPGLERVQAERWATDVRLALPGLAGRPVCGGHGQGSGPCPV